MPKLCDGAVQQPAPRGRVEFAADRPLPPSFKTLRAPLTTERDYSLTARPGWLRLFGGQTLSSHHRQTLFASRWESFSFDVETRMDFHPRNFQQTAGLILYYDTCNWIYAYVTFDETANFRVLRILRCDNDDFAYGSENVPLRADTILTLRVKVRSDKARFLYAEGHAAPVPFGKEQPADHLSDDYIEKRRKRCAFTGAMVGICAQDMDAHRSFADFACFDYKEFRT